MSLQATYAGPFVHKTEKHNPTEIIVRLEKKYPRASQEKIERLFLAEVEEAREYLIPCLRYYFLNAWVGLHPAPRRAPAHRISKDEVDKAERRLKAAVVLSEMVMPNGKKLAMCTGTEMATFGRFGAAVAKRAKRQVVGKVLKERDLTDIWFSVRGV
jgi:hypothetical protein